MVRRSATRRTGYPLRTCCIHDAACHGTRCHGSGKFIRAQILVSAIKTYAYCSVVTRCGDSSNKTVQRECEVRLVQMFDRIIAPECSDFKTATGSGHSSLQRFESTRAEASVVRRKGPIEPMSWRPAVAEIEDSLSLVVSDAKQEARK